MNWTTELPFAITVCDKDGNILEMNDKSKKTFEKWGANLIGANFIQLPSRACKIEVNGDA